MSDSKHRNRIFLTEDEVAKRWRKSRRTLQRWRKSGTGPTYYVVNGSILYDLEDVLAVEAVTRVLPSS